MHSGIYAYHMDWNYMVKYHVVNYRILGLEDVNGNQGGAFNVHWERWHPSLSLGSTLGFVHLHIGFLYSTLVQYEEM